MIRPADDDDVAAIVALERTVFGAQAWSAASVDGELLTGTAVVAVTDDAIVGWAAVRPTDDVCDLTRVAVEPAARGAGIGRLLVLGVIDHARLGGAERMLLEVAADNVAALALYGATGFTPIARRSRYYPGGVDAVVMERHLGR